MARPRSSDRRRRCRPCAPGSSASPGPTLRCCWKARAASARSSSPVERQLFRPDLYYRLSGVDIRVPALRERRADILELARYFLERHRTTRRLRLSSAAADALLAYDWPGNVRELERMTERSVAL